ncbi:MAG: helix-turn-helix domain-containing protein [Candidatus Tectomicrobia bacterium]|uniref:Helix-turn-helix domain-containing protein n=1 Tax=Tectimicrobiota bacterium TaxID=2528274 RepID=A0A932I2Y9_UNCTE|nr:helix-turn-helix domain-containing protein [Candidatus Tectomicrobia bacterium]
MKLRLDKSAREAIGARVREIRLFNQLEQTELADRAGLSQAIISQYEKGLTEVSLSFIKFLADNFGVSGDWLIFGSGASPFERAQKQIDVRLPDEAGVATKRRRKRDGYTGIPLVDPRAAASPGKIRVEKVSEWEILPVQQTAGRPNLVALDLRGEWVKNMNPPLRAGSRAIVDRDDKEIQPDAYYAVNTLSRKGPSSEASVNAVRRLSRSGNRLWFVEDRPAGEFEHIDLKSGDRIEDVVIGRVIWVWQKMA